MSDDRLLREIARTARELEEREPGREWDRLAAGELDSEQAARLRARAEASPEAAAAWEAFQPLEEGDRARIVARLRAELPRAAPAPTPAPRAWRRTPAWLRFGLVPALAAAGLLVFVRPAGGPEALPGYELRVEGATRHERSATAPADSPTAPLRFAPGNRLELLLTPATSAGPAVEARAFIDAGAGFEPLAFAAQEASAQGALRFSGVVGRDVLLPDGDATLVIVVARPGAFPPTAELQARLERDSRVAAERWTAWKLRVRGTGTP